MLFEQDVVWPHKFLIQKTDYFSVKSTTSWQAHQCSGQVILKTAKNGQQCFPRRGTAFSGFKKLDVQIFSYV